MASFELCLVYLVLDTGERLPCLVHRQTWLPVRLATRWAVRYRRYRVQASTLASNLRVLSQVYQWAWRTAGLDLDDYFTNDQLLSGQQLESLSACLRENATGRDGGAIVPNTYNYYLSVTEEFLKWCLCPANRGGNTTLSLEELTAERERLTLFFRSMRLRPGQAQRIQPLTNEEIIRIRETIRPRRNQAGEWINPPGIFSPQTVLRNWLMFETAYELGLRRGELLKLRLDCLPRGSNESILVQRFPDDPHDTRTREPAVKTAARKIPASRPLLQAIRQYITTPPPVGRVQGETPYLFVTRDGGPVTIDTAQGIIRAIGKHSGIQPLSWHRLRHTWAERMADLLLDQPNGMDVLLYLGGWRSPMSAQRYIQNALTRRGGELLQQYQAGLYPLGGESDDLRS